MAQYYRNPFSNRRDDDKTRRSFWFFIVDAVMLCISAVSAVILLFTVAGRYMSPEHLWYFSLAGLVMPVVYVGVIISTLYWIIRWKWTAAAIMAAFLIAGLFYVPLYYKFDFTRRYAEAKPDRTAIKVMTYNVRLFLDDRFKSVRDSIMSLVLEERPDIICFQEYPYNAPVQKTLAELLKTYKPTDISVGKSGISLICLSRYPIIATGQIDSLSGSGLCMWADLRIDEDTVRLYNVHLQTTSLSRSDKDYINNHRFISDSTREERFHNIAQSLLNNNLRRAQQVERIHAHIAECRSPKILCGDFNDVPMSYAHYMLSRGLDDTFSEQGHGYVNTFRGFFNMLRIDFILKSPEFETLSYDIVKSDRSDHYPVISRLKLTQKQ